MQPFQAINSLLKYQIKEQLGEKKMMKRKNLMVLLTMVFVVLTACGTTTGSNVESAVTEQTDPKLQQKEVQEELILDDEVTEKEHEKEPEIETVYLISKKTDTSNWLGEINVDITEYTYDEYGNELTFETIDKEGEVTHKVSNVYDDNGYLVEKTKVLYDAEIITKYEYDEFGNVIKEDSNISTIIYEYDNNNILVKESAYDENNQLMNEYEYNENETRRKYVTYEAGEIRSFYEYNEHGDEIKYYRVGTDEIVERNYNNEYDTNGNLIKVTETMTIKNISTGEIAKEESITEYEFDNHNLLIKSAFDNGSIIYTNEYDSNGNMIESICVNNEITTREVYEYDNNDNLIKYIAYDENGNIASQTEWEYIALELAKTDK